MATVAYGTTWKEWVDYPSWYYPGGTWTTGTGTHAYTATTNQTYVWKSWNTTSTIHLTLQDNVWRDWQAVGYIRDEIPTYREYHRLPPETAEERVARLDREQTAREEASRRQLAEQARMEGAQERAMELLLMVLTNEERLWHDLHDEIMVRADSGRMYVIEKRGVHGNIRQVDEHGCMLGRVCVAPGMYDQDARLSLPLADGWLGQYLAVKHNEEALRATGNWSYQGECKQPGVPILQPLAARAA